MAISIVICGSTHHTALCAQALLADTRFTITGILTPSPKPIGRKKEVTLNPLHQFADTHSIPVVTIESKINEVVRESLTAQIERPDILLVVDFGYIVPKWLLEWPLTAPINIHPSDLPSYRGSSPGQFTLLFGEQQSAVTVIQMDEKLDHGPIVEKLSFPVQTSWTAGEYYAHAFSLITKELASILAGFDPNALTKQSDESSTPTARILSREDGYVPQQVLRDILSSGVSVHPIELLAQQGIASSAQSLYNMWRGLTPWPGIWTKATIGGKEVRIKLLESSLQNGKFMLKTIQVEGKLPTSDTDLLTNK